MKMRRAKRSSAKPLIGLYAESGKGKTFSALLMARGFVGQSGRVVVIETESGRGEAYVDDIPGGYDVIPLGAPFSPERYGEAISLAEREGADALVIDSASHEWEGIGGVCDMAHENAHPSEPGVRPKKGMLVWQKPKTDHNKLFVGRLLQTSIPLVIVCMRAKYPMRQAMVRGKMDWVRSDSLSPKQSEDILYELMAHAWLDGNHCMRVTKATPMSIRSALVDGERVSIETGRRLAEWSKGAGAPAASTQSASVGSVLADIDAAETIADLEACKDDAAQLTGDDKTRARVAFMARKKEIEVTT
jgi:hypothetical protein